MHILGIDPGLSGAIATLAQDGTLLALTDLPVIEQERLKWIDGGRFASLLMEIPGPKRAIVERVSAMPKQGVASSFNFGVGYGSVLGVLQAMHIPIKLVTPAKWKRDIGLERDKKASLYRARLHWPTAELHLEKHHGRAEALLIAEYGRTHD